MKRIYVVGTADTKGEELHFLGARIRAAGAAALLVDVGTRALGAGMDVSAEEVAGHHSAGAEAVLGLDGRGLAVAAMGEALEAFLASRKDIAGVVAVGGGGGPSIATRGMRALPLGVPKLMVSTLASGDTAPFVGVSDIAMMPAVTDMAGLNAISRTVLHNAAQAIAGMARSPAPAAEGRPALGLTMFGVTTPCVTAAAEMLKPDYEPMIFHATGTGGRTMEKLADSGMLAGFLDLTTTEVCDFLLGGVLPASADRLGAVIRTGLPYVGSVGACDMVNFWAPETVPEKYRRRLLHHHNPHVTLMRTTAEENRAVGRWIGERLNACEGPVRFLLPELGVSALDTKDGGFFDPQADAALFDAVEGAVRQTERRRVERLPLHINDPAFAKAAVAAFRAIAR